jgi:hypothetical protein
MKVLESSIIRLIIVFCIICAILSIANAMELCAQQDYSDPNKPPNWECPGPGESVLLPDIKFNPSVGLKMGSQYNTSSSGDMTLLDYDAVLMDVNKTIQLALRISGLRRLRWLDMHRGAELLKIEKKYIQDRFQARLELEETRAKIYKKQRDQAYKWYRSWSSGFIFGVVATTTIVITTFFIAR